MRAYTQEEKIQGMMERPIPKKKVGIVHLEMIKESRCLYGMKRISDSKTAAEMVRPLLEKADREMLLVLSLDSKLEPMALEIAAVGGVNSCLVDMKSIFRHAILNNAAYVICFHNHPSGDCEPSTEDRVTAQKMEESGKVLGLTLVDHIIIGAEGSFLSLAEMGILNNRFEVA